MMLLKSCAITLIVAVNVSGSKPKQSHKTRHWKKHNPDRVIKQMKKDTHIDVRNYGPVPDDEDTYDVCTKMFWNNFKIFLGSPPTKDNIEDMKLKDYAKARYREFTDRIRVNNYDYIAEEITDAVGEESFKQPDMARRLLIWSLQLQDACTTEKHGYRWDKTFMENFPNHMTVAIGLGKITALNREIRSATERMPEYLKAAKNCFKHLLEKDNIVNNQMPNALQSYFWRCLQGIQRRKDLTSENALRDLEQFIECISHVTEAIDFTTLKKDYTNYKSSHKGKSLFVEDINLHVFEWFCVLRLARFAFRSGRALDNLPEDYTKLTHYAVAFDNANVDRSEDRKTFRGIQKVWKNAKLHLNTSINPKPRTDCDDDELLEKIFNGVANEPVEEDEDFGENTDMSLVWGNAEKN